MFGYLIDTFAQFLAPSVAEGIAAVVLVPAAIGELSFVAWLLVKGVRVREPGVLVPAVAA